MEQPNLSIGALVQLACSWEVLARKAGNVCPGREFPDLTVADFLKSAAAIAPVLDQAPTQPLGVTILRAIEETRKVVGTNTNLGIVLLLAPLASVPLDQPLQPGLSAVLARTTIEDAGNAYAAIRLAHPGGLGDAPEQDVKDAPTLPLRDVMALAKDRDLIAAQYAEDFQVVPRIASLLTARIQERHNIERGIIEAQIELLADLNDSLIVRKTGDAGQAFIRHVAGKLGRLEMPVQREAYIEFDAWLRSDNHLRNPGTTADLLAAALFVALRDERIAADTPFTWQDHPFGSCQP